MAPFLLVPLENIPTLIHTYTNTLAANHHVAIAARSNDGSVRDPRAWAKAGVIIFIFLLACGILALFVRGMRNSSQQSPRRRPTLPSGHVYGGWSDESLLLTRPAPAVRRGSQGRRALESPPPPPPYLTPPKYESLPEYESLPKSESPPKYEM